MIKVLIILLVFGFTVLNTILRIRNKSKVKSKKNITPKLSDLHGKEFSDYIDNLRRDL